MNIIVCHQLSNAQQQRQQFPPRPTQQPQRPPPLIPQRPVQPQVPPRAALPQSPQSPQNAGTKEVADLNERQRNENQHLEEILEAEAAALESRQRKAQLKLERIQSAKWEEIAIIQQELDRQQKLLQEERVYIEKDHKRQWTEFNANQEIERKALARQGDEQRAALSLVHENEHRILADQLRIQQAQEEQTKPVTQFQRA